MSIDWIKEKVSKGEYEIRKHALERSVLRAINPLDVKEAILGGEIIEDYPEDSRGHSCLIYGTSSSGKKLHVVCKVAHGLVWIITVYEREDEWIDFKIRRKKK